MNRMRIAAVGTICFLVAACKELPDASFTISRNTVEVGDTVYLTSTCTDAEQWEWDFGDGTGSEEEHPWHIYTAEETYTILLVATNQDGSDEASGTVWVNPATGKLVDVIIHSPGLEGNLLGDSPDRAVTIYLPPAYALSPDRNYPVIYLLHGYNCTNATWFGANYIDLSIKPMLDDLILEGTIEPVIAVSPNSDNRFGGSWYTNSTVSGNWEDFIVQDVVDYTDAHYRTLAKAGSRGILGHSMGGYGTIKLAMKHPDVFSACYSMSGAYLVFDEYLSDSAMVAAMIEAFYNDPISELDLLISTVVAWAPNPSIPDYYGEIPYTEDGTLKDSVFQVYMQHDPYSMIDDLSANLETLSLLQFDCGTSDWWIIQNRHFSEKLTSRGIDHTFLEYDGDHTNRLAERLEDLIFIALSQHLEHE